MGAETVELDGSAGGVLSRLKRKGLKRPSGIYMCWYEVERQLKRIAVPSYREKTREVSVYLMHRLSSMRCFVPMYASQLSTLVPIRSTLPGPFQLAFITEMLSIKIARNFPLKARGKAKQFSHVNLLQ